MLARQYPNVQAASTEIINLQAILNLPKGTEHFISDVHGEYEAFLPYPQLLPPAWCGKSWTSCSAPACPGRSGISWPPSSTTPEEKLELISQTETWTWRSGTASPSTGSSRCAGWSASKYTRSKVRKALPKEYAYIIDELLHTHYEDDGQAGLLREHHQHHHRHRPGPQLY